MVSDESMANVSSCLETAGINFPGGHSTRTLLLSPNNPNLLAVSHGSNDNFDYPSGNPKTARACVKVFDLSAIPSGGYNYVSGGWLAGYGMRNEVGIAFDGNNMFVSRISYLRRELTSL